MAELPPLPAGFTIDAQAQSHPPLPPGFSIDGEQQSQQPQQQKTPGLFDRTMQSMAVGNPFLAAGAEMMAHAGSGALASPLAGYVGLGATATGADAANAVQGTQEALTYQPRTPLGQGLAAIGGYVPGKIAQAADWAGQQGADATGSPAVGAAINTAAQMAPALLLRGGMPGGKVANGRNQPAPARAAPPVRPVEEAPPNAAQAGRQPGPQGVPAAAQKPAQVAPSVEQLKADASAAYKRAEDAGINLSEFSVKKLKGRLLNEVGRADPTLHPDTTAAMKRIMDTKGDISLSKLDELRQIAKDAKGSTKPGDQRLAGQIVETIDNYVDQLGSRDVTSGDPKAAGALKEARDLYTRQKKGEQVEEMFRRAEIKAGANYTQSGLENALRGEFKALALDKKKLGRFTPEERAAITKVAKGAPVENTIRMLGKLSPEGAIPIMANLAAAASTGGASLALTGAAWGARRVATQMTMKKANAVGELVRRGPRNALAEPAATPAKRNALAES